MTNIPAILKQEMTLLENAQIKRNVLELKKINLVKKTTQCLLGLYCNGEKCVPQKKEKETCAVTTECQNAFLCWKKTCQNVWFSLPEGTDVKADGDFNPSWYCQYGSATTDGHCLLKNSTDAFDKKTGLFKCEVGAKCSYKDYNGTSTVDCTCGFNKEGLAYCPKGHNADDDSNWKNYNNALKSVYTAKNSKCHSETRDKCYVVDEGDATDMKHYKHLTTEAHIFQNADDCVERLLSSSYVQISVGVLALLAMILF